MNVTEAKSAREIAAVRELFEEYAASLGVDLGYQDFAAELAALPGAYTSPRGRLLLATAGNISIGCVGLRPHSEKICEMKRLYVRRSHQGQGIGRSLAEHVIDEARRIGYSLLLLDTLPGMDSAIRLYESLGFIRREPYFESPIEGNVFLELRL